MDLNRRYPGIPVVLQTSDSVSLPEDSQTMLVHKDNLLSFIREITADFPKSVDAAMKGEFNPYSTAESILINAPNAGLTIEPKKIRLLGNALQLARLFMDMPKDVPLDEINKRMREENVTRPFFIQALRYFLSSSVEKDQVRAAALIYTLYLDSKRESRTEDLKAAYKEAKRKIDILNGEQPADKAALALPPGGIDLNQINVLRNGKTVNVQFDPAQLNELVKGGFEGFTPVIINMTPIQSPFQLLGINPAKEPEAFHS
jgi:hypothetical protein